MLNELKVKKPKTKNQKKQKTKNKKNKTKQKNKPRKTKSVGWIKSDHQTFKSYFPGYVHWISWRVVASQPRGPFPKKLS